MAFFPKDFTMPKDIRVFFVFEGTKEHQITETAIDHKLNAFKGTIPGF